MLIDRAQEILNSQNNIEVLYKNKSVWLEKVNNDRNTVSIKDLSSNMHIEVPVSELVETGIVK